MSTARQAESWDRDSVVILMLYQNLRANCGGKLPKKTVEDFNPFAAKAKSTPIPIEALKALDPRRRRQKR